MRRPMSESNDHYILSVQGEYHNRTSYLRLSLPISLHIQKGVGSNICECFSRHSVILFDPRPLQNTKPTNMATSGGFRDSYAVMTVYDTNIQ